MMDIVLHVADTYLFTPYIYPAEWAEDWWPRQLLSLFFLVNISGYALYLIFATLSYIFIYDKALLRHPRILENQIAKELWVACTSIPIMSIPTNLIFLAEVRGYSKLYDNVDEYGWGYLAFSAVFFLFFTDMCIYWIHRWLHHPLIYKYVHKPHHRWLVPTPFASHAFHPVDGFLQSSPYHMFIFLFPLHKMAYMGLFVFVNFWTISIHDGSYGVPDVFKPLVNGAAHHTDHHLFFNYNYGQFFTLWDRIGGSFRHPSSFEGTSPLDEVHQLDKKAAAAAAAVTTAVTTAGDKQPAASPSASAAGGEATSPSARARSKKVD
ncbi:sterol-C5-desaturase [Capsaspora owczarzaki ATCC 30864]|uniref:Sterol-C5-desaturase n=1 Tax=Capsaspora owczarzaki (strain ATCC 30864) TaxID=595528 RepID=A0A0D2X0N5_CAPO3|nr:sterol-C5-desaturase [Capsaspora owczarzaki ATCC 30864]KJE89369.1 sterol-C5-desaturase [Capsaspora owczarzaki ATCC 30864]|eukprot:XP_004365724.1 sterol-C5-desaturase [Capsaspora owczarzaki ATCC 30864]